MRAIIQDLRYGLRLVLKRPGFTFVAVITLALGIGANTAIFSVVDAVLLRPLPYPQAERLVFVWSTMIGQGVPVAGSSMPDYREWRDRSDTLEGLGGFYYGDFNLASSGAGPERVEGALITANLFDVLQVSPALGRSFTAGEDQYGRHHVVLLSYGLWQRRFSGDPGIVGRELKIGGEGYTVVGVMPKGMPFFDNLPEVELWRPIAFAPGDNLDTRNNHFVTLVGRLKAGVTSAQAQDEMSAIARQIEEAHPENKGVGARVSLVQEQLTDDSRTALLVLLGAVAFVLLVACVNVANLMLARAAAREREMAIRASLGASRWRLVGQMVVECLPFSLMGAGLGVLLALWGIDLLSALLPSSLPRYNPIGVNGHVLGFTLAAALLTVLLAGLLPALQTARADVQAALNEGGRSGTGGVRQGRLRRLLVVAEVALALVLLVGAGLMVRSFIKLRRVDVGFGVRNVLTFSLSLPDAKYPVPTSANDPRNPASLAFYDQLLARLEALPGVRAATAATLLPLGAGSGWGKNMSIEGRPAPDSLDQVPVVRFALISPDYFSTFGISVRDGRAFTTHDDENAQPVAIINETLARRFFAGEDPVGKTIWMGPPEHLLPPDQQTPDNRFVRRLIVGVVADVKGGSLNLPTPPLVYAPLHQFRREGYVNTLALAVQTEGRPDGMAEAIREQVHALDADQPVSNLRNIDQLLDRALSAAKFSLFLLSLFAGVGLLLAGVGIYGVMSYAVTQRTHELGIRMALGARPADVLGMVIRQGMVLVAAGVAAGVAGAWALTRLMTSLLFGVSATDVLTFAVVALLLGGVALVACYLPARRATRVDPMVALRCE
jgi:putative ABC transport system permease protein